MARITAPPFARYRNEVASIMSSGASFDDVQDAIDSTELPKGKRQRLSRIASRADGRRSTSHASNRQPAGRERAAGTARRRRSLEAGRALEREVRVLAQRRRPLPTPSERHLPRPFHYDESGVAIRSPRSNFAERIKRLLRR